MIKPELNNCVAVVTGAGSGIGRALALELSRRGARLAISDNNIEGLEQTVTMLGKQSANIHSQTLDVSNRTAVFDYALRVAEYYGEVNLVINNAGVGLSSGLFSNTTIEEFEWLMGINFNGVVYGTKAFLPELEKAKWGHIVNISSLFGLIGVAEQSAYNSSKFAVRGFTECLCNEFEQTDSSVRATSVHPGGVKTNIARNARLGERLDEQERAEAEGRRDEFDLLAKTTPESAAEQILEAVEKRQRRLLIGADAKFLDKVQRVLPTRYNSVFVWLAEKIVARGKAT